MYPWAGFDTLINFCNEQISSLEENKLILMKYIRHSIFLRKTLNDKFSEREKNINIIYGKYKWQAAKKKINFSEIPSKNRNIDVW
jgi:hypothetical protein